MENALSTVIAHARTQWIDRLEAVAVFIPLNGRFRLKPGVRGACTESLTGLVTGIFPDCDLLLIAGKINYCTFVI